MYRTFVAIVLRGLFSGDTQVTVEEHVPLVFIECVKVTEYFQCNFFLTNCTNIDHISKRMIDNYLKLDVETVIFYRFYGFGLFSNEFLNCIFINKEIYYFFLETNLLLVTIWFLWQPIC